MTKQINYIQQNGQINKRDKIGTGLHRIEELECEEFYYTVVFSKTTGEVTRLRQMHLIDGIDIGVNLNELPLNHQFAINNEVSNYLARVNATKTVDNLNETLGSIFNHFK